MPRKFEVLDRIPGRTIAAPLTTDENDLLHAIICAKGGYVRVPHDMIAADFETLDHIDKKQKLQNYATLLKKGTSWRRPDGQIRTATRVGEDYGLFAWWEPK